MDDTPTSQSAPLQPAAKDVSAADQRPAEAAPDPISAGLKALWAAMENEPVPDEFLALLDRIDSANPAETPTPPEAPANGSAA